MKKILDVEGMTCLHCVMHVQKALLEIEGVSKVKVNLKKNNAEVKGDDAVTDEMMSNAVKEAGYKVVSVSPA